MTTTKFRVPAMDCPTEQRIIEHRLDQLGGIEGIDFDLIDRLVTVRHQAGLEPRVEAALRDIGMKPERITVEGATPSLSGATAWQRGAWLLALAGACAIGAEVLAWTGFAESSWPVIAASVAAIAIGGPTTFRKGLVAVRTLTLNINLLMTIAVVGAIAIGQWPEAAMVTVLFAVAELIESRSTDRARDAIRALMALSPDTARVRRGDAWVALATAAVVPGDVMQVLPGDRIALDAISW